MRINYEHDNTPSPDGGDGGSVCMCSKCQNKREQESASPTKYLIWSKKRGGAWYRPESAGYTGNPDIAGRYSEMEASNAYVGTHGDCVGYPENSPFVTRKRNEYLQKKRREIRSCLETMTPQQVMEIMPGLVSERIDLLVRGGI